MNNINDIVQDKLITTGNEKYGAIPESLRDKIALYESGKCYVNESLLTEDSDLMNLINLATANNDIKEVISESSADIKARYSGTDINALTSSILQKSIKNLFERAALEGASDISFQVRATETVIKIRVHGDMKRLEEYTSDKGHSICSTIYRTMCNQASKSFKPKEVQDARISASHLPFTLSGARVATTPTDDGYYMVCRLLYKPKEQNPSLIELGYESYQTEIIDRLKSNPSGVVIVCGATGSGKSTSLLVVTSSIITDNEGKISVITVEQPPEYSIFGWEPVKNNVKTTAGKKIEQENEFRLVKSYAVQTPVPDKGKSKNSKESAYLGQIKACMRLDPDVIMIGEVRDLESADAALQASMSGHLVFTTVHANDVLTIFPRIINLGVNKSLACDAKIVTGLVSQTLLKQICPHCSLDIKSKEAIEILNSNNLKEKEANLSKLKRFLISYGFDINEINNTNDIEQLLKIKKSRIDLTGVRIRNPDGCEKCRDGIKGRTVVAEVLKTDNKFMQYTLEDRKDDLENYWMKECNGVNMQMTGLIKVKKGITDFLEVESSLGFIELHKYTNLDNFYNLLEKAELENYEMCKQNGYYKDDFEQKNNNKTISVTPPKATIAKVSKKS